MADQPAPRDPIDQGLPARGPRTVDEYGDFATSWWERANHQASEPNHQIEHYPAGAGSQIAQELHDSGLLYKLNRDVLHRHGFALTMIDVSSLAGLAAGLALTRVAHPVQIEFDERQHQVGQRKLTLSGLE